MGAADRLFSAVAAVAPVEGVSINNTSDRSTWRIDYADHATPEQMAAAQAVVASIDLAAPTSASIDIEWSRRVFGEFAFDGETYHADRDSVDNIIGAYTMAQEAIGLGVQAGNRYWHYPDPTDPPEGAVEFAWKSQSNGMIPMDAPTVVALGKALFAHKHAHFLKARALKEMDPIPADYTSDTYWP